MGCLLLGTEDGRLLVLDPAGTKVMHSWKAGGVPAFLTVTGMHLVCRGHNRGGTALDAAAAVDLPACVKWLHGAAQQASVCAPGMHITCRSVYALELFVSAEGQTTAKAPPSASQPPVLSQGSKCFNKCRLSGSSLGADVHTGLL